jgi:hypothetical protein
MAVKQNLVQSACAGDTPMDCAEPLECARRELRDELRRLVDLLGGTLAAQRAAGRMPGGDMLRGMVIEDDEAASLLDALASDLAQPVARRDGGACEPSPPSAESGSETPLSRATRRFRMLRPERLALILAIAVELDQRFARVVAYLNDHIAQTRPTLGLVLALAGMECDAAGLRRRPALRYGLLLLEGDGPLATRSLRVAPELLDELAGVTPAPWRRDGETIVPVEIGLDALMLDPAQRAMLSRWAETLRAGPPFVPLVLSGPAGAGRATTVRAASGRAAREVVELAWPAEPPDRTERFAAAARAALWHEATLLLRFGESAQAGDLGEAWSLSRGWEDVPIALAVPPGLAEAACAAAPREPVLIGLGEGSIGQRATLWRGLLAGHGAAISDAELYELAARYDFLPGTLARAVRRAVAECAFGGEPLAFAALARACRVVGSAGIGPIAQRLPQPYTRRDLVLPAEVHEELDLAASWLRNRRQVFENWGFGRRVMLGQGMTALFTGEPGTGKTMAAQVLARELGLELFRVDLSRVMSKYIGETEKNLSDLFDGARASGAMLFFDEADVLFSKRSEVKDAHDRYANLEVGYLLQRLEEHTGATVLATNRLGDLDEAFTRRFHFIIDFPLPNAADRRRIWEGMLPPTAEREPRLDLEGLARDYEITGGEIRNSVLSAAFLAAEEGRPIGLRHLKRGLRRELLKTGRVLDISQRRALEGE